MYPVAWVSAAHTDIGVLPSIFTRVLPAAVCAARVLTDCDESGWYRVTTVLRVTAAGKNGQKTRISFITNITLAETYRLKLLLLRPAKRDARCANMAWHRG